MPIHLLPTDREGRARLNRREFLARLAAGGAALALGRRATGDDRGPAWFALVSDTHIAADPKQVARGQVMAENLKAVVADLLGLARSEGNPEGVFVDGDLAFNHGEPGDYRTFLDLIAPLREAGMPVHLALGNHDDREHFRDAIGDGVAEEAAVVDKHVSVVTATGLRFVVLDSLDRVNVTPGRLGERQVEWLAARLDEDRKTPTVVFLHHNLRLPSNGHAAGALIDTGAFLEAIRTWRQVQAIVYGHTHVWTQSRLDGGPMVVNLPAVGYPFAADQPIGWVVLRPGDGGAELELRCVGGERAKDRERVRLGWG